MNNKFHKQCRRCHGPAVQSRHVAWLLCPLLAFAAGGCVTMTDSSEQMRAREDQAILQKDITAVQGRMESVEMENQRLHADLEKLRGSLSGATEQQRATLARLDDLERRLQQLDAAREKDRQAILNQLSANLAEVLAAAGKTSGGGKPAGKASGATANGARAAAGYEHVVQEGETLSAIAAAYKVKTADIIAANDLANPHALKLGQTLIIPKPAP